MTETTTPTITHAQIADAIRQATQEVFSTMLGLEMVPGETHIGHNASNSYSGIVALLGLAGAWAGSGQLCCDPNFARLVASRMLMAEYPAVDDEVLDAMAEIANMVVGNVKTLLEHHIGPMGLGIPTVVFGHNLETRSVGSPEWVILPFSCSEGTLNVQITLAPKRRRIPL